MEAEGIVKSESVVEDRADQFHIDDYRPSVTLSWRQVHQAALRSMVKGSSGASAYRLRSYWRMKPTCMRKLVNPVMLLNDDRDEEEQPKQVTEVSIRKSNQRPTTRVSKYNFASEASPVKPEYVQHSKPRIASKDKLSIPK